MDKLVLLIRASADADPEVAHGDAVRSVLAELPDTRFVTSLRCEGSVDFVDVLEIDPEVDDPAAIAELFAQDGALEVEALPATASPSLRAPGAPGAPG